MSVAESMVIFGPIFQVGWLSASSTVAAWMRARSQSRNGPPLAVMRISRTSCGPRPASSWCRAQCSESTGSSSPPPSASAWRMSAPPTTRLSLLATQTRRPLRRAASTLARPAAPTTAATTVSAPAWRAQAMRPSMPCSTAGA